ncbi:MAG: hypothetical protein NC350_03040 [Corallococcus sp.]|nr:hypothetical protein [Corallococcus sp.]
MPYLTVITSDLFDISSRLKEIDSNYFVCYNRKAQRYEVHNGRQRGNTFCLAVPYGCLDARTVDLVRKTRVENAEKLWEEMERHNSALAGVKGGAIES